MAWDKEEAQKSNLFKDFRAKEGAQHLETYSIAAGREKSQP